MVNLHFSLLPRWRGAAPVERAILAGDRETGCLPHEGRGGARHRSRLRRAHACRSTTTITLAALRARAGRPSASALARRRAGRRGRRVARPRAAGGRGHDGGEDHQGGSPPRLGASRPSSSSGSCASGRAWTTFRGKRLTVLDAALGADRAPTPPTASTRFARTARSSRRVAARWCCAGCSPRAVLPCQPTSGCAACGPRSASVSGRTRHESGDRDSDRRVEPRPVRAVPFGTPAALRRSPDAVPPRPRRAHRRPRVRDGRPDQDPARGDGGQGDGRHRLVAGHAGPGPVGVRRRARALVRAGRHRHLARRGPRPGVRQRVAPVDRRSPQPAGAHAHRARPRRAAGLPGAGQLPPPVAPAGAGGGQRAALHRRALRGRPRGPGPLRPLARALRRPPLRAGGEGPGRAHGGLRPRARVDGRGRRMGHGHPADALSQAAEPRAVRRVRRALPGAADRRARRARAVLLRVPAHPLLGPLQPERRRPGPWRHRAATARPRPGPLRRPAHRAVGPVGRLRHAGRAGRGGGAAPPTGCTSTSWTGTSSPT